MSLFFGIIIGLIALVFLVVVHELAHAIVASRNGVVVEEFGIGLPPRAWSKKLKNGILFTLNWLPIGGFVKLQGEHDAANKKGDYGAASFWKKTKVLLAGVIANWALAALLLTIIALVGMPKVLPNQFSIASDSNINSGRVEIVSLTPDYPAEKSGLKPGDSIIKFAGSDISSSTQLINLIGQNKNTIVPVVYVRDNVESTVDLSLGESLSGGTLGASLGQRETVRSTWSAPVVGVVTTAQFTWETLGGLSGLVGNLVNGVFSQFNPDPSIRQQASDDLKEVSSSVAGPIGILGTIFPAASQAGPVQLIFLVAIVSLTLAVMNILPIPALDGGRWFTMALFKITKKSLTFEREEKIQAIGFYILMALIILVTITDVAKIF
ncbi:MAG: M50 family metallopeptidase [Candidatus Saccharibacteria bacterium]